MVRLIKIIALAGANRARLSESETASERIL